MNTITFVTANFAAREAGYNVTDGWGECVRTTRARYEPLEGFAAAFDGMLGEVQGMGFAAIDLWTEMLHYRWATDEHVRLAREALERRGMSCVALAGPFGDTPEELERTCGMAVALGARILGGHTPLLKTDRTALVAALERHDLVYALENHPEKTPEELLAKAGDAAGGHIGVAVDTGWFGTQGFDAAEALRRLGDRVAHVHLKDVLEVGRHETCRFGRGVVPLRECVRAVREIGYGGPIDIEHEPETFDPAEDIVSSRKQLEGWLGEA